MKNLNKDPMVDHYQQLTELIAVNCAPQSLFVQDCPVADNVGCYIKIRANTSDGRCHHGTHKGQLLFGKYHFSFLKKLWSYSVYAQRRTRTFVL